MLQQLLALEMVVYKKATSQIKNVPNDMAPELNSEYANGRMSFSKNFNIKPARRSSRSRSENARYPLAP